MAICKKYGYPDLFITMTCNSNWQEIGRVNNPRNLKVEDRPNISCRVFKIQLDMIISDLKQGIPFGVLDAVVDDSGYPSYRRRDTWVVIEKKGVHMDNRNVVPYNAYLLMSYQAHVNIEYCNKSNAIKYLFKYVNKGPDRVAVGVTKEASSGEDAQVIDEIKEFYDCRYLSACEAVWRTLAYDIHQRWPSVMRLTFHLPGEQNIIFKDDDDL
ncbi:uncharacterized protein [Arachis hypogaea]|uniref:uncharacterized protein n=1 Tax=Arachis hypogaea TaxID=3818 RepID=UPI003B20F92C